MISCLIPMFECCRYPYNNFLHHHVENIIISCLESKNSSLQEHLLRDCDFIGKIIQTEKHFTLDADANKVHGSPPPPTPQTKKRNCITMNEFVFFGLSFDTTLIYSFWRISSLIFQFFFAKYSCSQQHQLRVNHHPG